ncbi:MAG: orotate phosphoribosyltransferase [Firmicutes bacterium]|nr:orotate phosphoribosyltransferase [Bacillota bacterium]MBQ4340147.1 orotate phosphoribosyltransferase [Bacillota bacterium]
MEKKAAEILLGVKAVFLRPEEPFTWASGIKSPIYCDNRLVLSYPEERTAIKKGMVELIKKEYPEVEVIMGTATAGIPMAALAADEMGIPMGYVRSDAKKHGKQNQIEGRIEPGQKVVIVEDLISTGGSVKTVVNALKEAGADILGVAAIFTYGLPDSFKNFEEMGVEFRTLSNYDVLIKVAAEKGYVKPEMLDKLQQWKSDPKDESWIK